MQAKNVSKIWVIRIHLIWSIETDNPNSISNPSHDDEAYYDGDQQILQQNDLFQSVDCSIQCPPHWTEPVVQQTQSLVYPTSASISFKCPYYAKPNAKITWIKDGYIFSPELTELVKVKFIYFCFYWLLFSLQLITCI